MTILNTQETLIGQTIAGKYRILSQVGIGGMGGVYKAEHLLMDRHVAIKLLPPTLAADEVSLRRFEHEARIASQLTHPNAVVLHDFGSDDEFRYLVMEFIHGKTLKDVISSQEPLPVSRVSKIIAQVANALNEAHSRGIVHRDVKPSNIMLTTRGQEKDIVKVVDFGIAKVIHESQSKPSDLTLSGSVMGTPQYLSPEQVLSKELDARSDIYSLGIVLFEMLSGSVPYETASSIELMMKHVYSDVPSLRVRLQEKGRPKRVSKELAAFDSLIQRCLQKDPKDRFQSIEEFLQELSRITQLSAPSHTKTAASPFVSGIVFGGVLLVGLIAWKELRPPSRHVQLPMLTSKSEETVSSLLDQKQIEEEHEKKRQEMTEWVREEKQRLADEMAAREQQAKAVETARLAEEVRKAEEQKLREAKMQEEITRANQAMQEAKAEAERQTRAAQAAEERARRQQQQESINRRAVQVKPPVARAPAQSTPPVFPPATPSRVTPPASSPAIAVTPPEAPASDEGVTKKRRRCGPGWCP